MFQRYRDMDAVYLIHRDVAGSPQSSQTSSVNARRIIRSLSSRVYRGTQKAPWYLPLNKMILRFILHNDSRTYKRQQQKWTVRIICIGTDCNRVYTAQIYLHETYAMFAQIQQAITIVYAPSIR